MILKAHCNLLVFIMFPISLNNKSPQRPLIEHDTYSSPLNFAQSFLQRYCHTFVQIFPFALKTNTAVYLISSKTSSQMNK